MMSLIEKLNSLAHLTPDEIATQLNTNGWIRWIGMSDEDWETYSDPNTRWILTWKYPDEIGYHRKYTDPGGTYYRSMEDADYYLIRESDFVEGQWPCP